MGNYEKSWGARKLWKVLGTKETNEISETAMEYLSNVEILENYYRNYARVKMKSWNTSETCKSETSGKLRKFCEIYLQTYSSARMLSSFWKKTHDTKILKELRLAVLKSCWIWSKKWKKVSDENNAIFIFVKYTQIFNIQIWTKLYTWRKKYWQKAFLFTVNLWENFYGKLSNLN